MISTIHKLDRIFYQIVVIKFLIEVKIFGQSCLQTEINIINIIEKLKHISLRSETKKIKSITQFNTDLVCCKHLEHVVMLSVSALSIHINQFFNALPTPLNKQYNMS